MLRGVGCSAPSSRRARLRLEIVVVGGQRVVDDPGAEAVPGRVVVAVDRGQIARLNGAQRATHLGRARSAVPRLVRHVPPVGVVAETAGAVGAAAAAGAAVAGSGGAWLAGVAAVPHAASRKALEPAPELQGSATAGHQREADIGEAPLLRASVADLTSCISASGLRTAWLCLQPAKPASLNGWQ